MNTTHHDRRVEHYRTSANRTFGRGFFVGFVACAIMVAAFMYGQRNAYGNERPAPRTAMSNRHAADDMAAIRRVPFFRTWLRIGMCEQPKPGISWHDVRTDRQRLHAIAWHQTYNNGFPGGLGMTPLLWEQFRRPSQRHVARMSSAAPVEQLWAAFRFWRWAERTYPGRGFTGWDCSRIIGWTTSNPQDAIR